MMFIINEVKYNGSKTEYIYKPELCLYENETKLEMQTILKTIDTSLKSASPRGSHDYKGILAIQDNNRSKLQRFLTVTEITI